ncbi:hypothetical protein TNIN_14311 [Trichonephila inaurata madagascariensis]|uniref:Uncharacterized protein n=1 Tax=Trichonephila inaurata madagascariensis TaxID=2747483 RepID=A0A8X6Y144_9ARAC|nr:hypothetical protein TNIN_14311 [Trichonephila inaurata madagascariensis]
MALKNITVTSRSLELELSSVAKHLASNNDNRQTMTSSTAESIALERSTLKAKAYTRSKKPRCIAVRNSSPAQPSNASRRHANMQKDEKGGQGGNQNMEKKSFHHSETS